MSFPSGPAAPVSGHEILVCPQTKQPLSPLSLDEARARMGGGRLAARSNAEPAPAGPTEVLMVRADAGCAYPVVDGIPVLLAPEQITREADARAFDLRDPRYAEAYEEMAFYNRVAAEEAEAIEESESYRIVAPLLAASPEARASFPHPRGLWIDAVYDCAGQWDAYEHIAPVRGGRVLQLGGKGIHAVKFALAGAGEAWVVTPMLGEARSTRALARAAGVAERVHCVVAIGEELPFAAERFDAIYSGGCLHHMTTALALPEAARVLRPGGRFAAVDPWRAPLYAIGTRLLGKREPDVYCRPITRERAAPLREAFSRARIVQHGALTRYPLLALNKFGLSLGLETVWRLNRLDDALSSLVPGLRGAGSSVALLGTK